MLRLVVGLAACCLVAGQSATAADVDDPRLRKGAFVGAHFVYAIPDFDFDAPVSTDDPLGFEVFGGYRFNRYVSLEGQVQYLPDFDVEGPNLFSGGRSRTDAWVLTMMPAVKGYPLVDVLPGWVQPYGMLGVGALLEAMVTWTIPNQSTSC